LVGIGLVAVLSLPWLRPYLPLPPERRAFVSPETPERAARFLRDISPPPRAFHSPPYGSYFTWAAPKVLVFVDTRFEFYSGAHWRDYFAVSSARYDWEEVLSRHDVETLVLERTVHGALIEAASTASGWAHVYEDDQAVILQRIDRP
jgi:hypothetical protein